MRESLELRNEFIFVSLCAHSQKTTFLAYIRLPLKEKKKNKTLPYISASHLVCIGETMQSTPVCQWSFFGESLLGECKKGWRVSLSLLLSLTLSLSVLVFAGKCLDGRGKSRARVRKEKASKRKNLDCLLDLDTLWGGKPFVLKGGRWGMQK